jgi:hypothetical protein
MPGSRFDAKVLQALSPSIVAQSYRYRRRKWKVKFDIWYAGYAPDWPDWLLD